MDMPFKTPPDAAIPLSYGDIFKTDEEELRALELRCANNPTCCCDHFEEAEAECKSH